MRFMVAFDKCKGMYFLTEGLWNVSKPFGTETMFVCVMHLIISACEQCFFRTVLVTFCLYIEPQCVIR